MAKHICIFAGPGTGKSTTCAGLFYKMKSNGYKVEYCTEYAKNLVFSKDFYRLKDQLYVLAKQSHPWFKLDSQVDYTINDGPFLLSIIYLQESEHIPKYELENLMVKMYKSYDTLNIFLERSSEHPYQEYGRNQTFNEAVELDSQIKDMLDKYDVQYQCVKVGESAVEEIYSILSKN